MLLWVFLLGDVHRGHPFFIEGNMMQTVNEIICFMLNQITPFPDECELVKLPWEKEYRQVHTVRLPPCRNQDCCGGKTDYEVDDLCGSVSYEETTCPDCHGAGSSYQLNRTNILEASDA